MKIALNFHHGGFSLSPKAILAIAHRKKTSPANLPDFCDDDKLRTDPDLVAVIETLGQEANGRNATLCIVEVPDDVDWTIETYDGYEHVAEVHRTWHGTNPAV